MSLVFESFDGGRDSIERLTQGLKVAAQESPEKSLIVKKDNILKLELGYTDQGLLTNDVTLVTHVLHLFEVVCRFKTEQIEISSFFKVKQSFSNILVAFKVCLSHADNFDPQNSFSLFTFYKHLRHKIPDLFTSKAVTSFVDVP